jgi:hypothetical protein
MYKDLIPTPRLSVGELRLHTGLKVFIRFQGTTLFRIPTREQSKNLHYKHDEGKSRRPFGWIDIHFNGGSASVNVPTVIGEDGYATVTGIELKNVAISSSVNYSELLRCKAVSANIHMPYTLKWNAPRTWKINIIASETSSFLLRDHITLFQDLVYDWTVVDPISSNEAAAVFQFVPLKYDISVEVKDLKLYLCVNELNIIDSPNDVDENSYIVLHAKKLDSLVEISALLFQPTESTVQFKVSLLDNSFNFSFPSSSTLSSFLSRDSQSILEISKFTIKGVYSYASSSIEENPDTFELDIGCQCCRLNAFGFLGRYLLVLADNYVSLHTTYITLEEYKTKGRNTEHNTEPEGSPMETNITATFEKVTVCLPERMYSKELHSTLVSEKIVLDSRINPHYQDVQIDSWPVLWRSHDKFGELVVESTSIHLHRMFGPLPSSIEYAVSMSINIEKIVGSSPLASLLGLRNFQKFFMFHFEDFDNRVLLPAHSLSSLIQAQLSVSEVDMKLLDNRSQFIHISLSELIFGLEDLLKGEETFASLEHLLVSHSMTQGNSIVELSHFTVQDVFFRDQITSESLAESLGSPISVTERERARTILNLDSTTGRLSHLLGRPRQFDLGLFAPALFKSSLLSLFEEQVAGKRRTVQESASVAGKSRSCKRDVSNGASEEFNSHIVTSNAASVYSFETAPDIEKRTAANMFTVFNQILDPHGESSLSKERSPEFAIPLPYRQYLGTGTRRSDSSSLVPQKSRFHHHFNFTRSSGQRFMLLDLQKSIDIKICPETLLFAVRLLDIEMHIDRMVEELYADFFEARKFVSNSYGDTVFAISTSNAKVTIIQDVNESEIAKYELNFDRMDAALGTNLVDIDLLNVVLDGNSLPIVPNSIDVPLPIIHFKSSSFSCKGEEEVLSDCSLVEFAIFRLDTLRSSIKRWEIPASPTVPTDVIALSVMCSLAPSIPDPSFLARPSNMWRLGNRPHQQSPVWRLLCSFMWNLKSPTVFEQARKSLQERAYQIIDLSDLSTYFKKWKISEAKAQPSSNMLINKASQPSPLFAFLRRKILQPLRFSFGRVHITIEESTFEMKTFSVQGNFGTRFHITAEAICLRVHPRLYSFFQAVVLHKAAPSEVSIRKQIEIHLTIAVQQVVVHGEAQQIKAEVELKDFMCSYVETNTHQITEASGPSSSTGIPAWVSSWCVSADYLGINVTSSQPLLKINIAGISGFLCSKIIIFFKDIKVDLPQNILQLYTFIDEWKFHLQMPEFNVNGDKPLGKRIIDVDIVAPKLSMALGVLPSLDVHFRVNVMLSISENWSFEISEHEIGFAFPNQAVTFVSLPLLRVASTISRVYVHVGSVEGEFSSSLLEPVETALKLLTREVVDVLELLLYLFPKNEDKNRSVTEPSESSPRTAITLTCAGAALSLVTEKGIIEVHSSQVIGSREEERWLFDSSQLRIAFMSCARIVLSEVQCAGAFISEKNAARKFDIRHFNMMVEPKALQQLMNLASYLIDEARARRASKAAELEKLGTTTQKIIESLDVKRNVEIPASDQDTIVSLHLLTCRIMLDSACSVEFLLRQSDLSSQGRSFSANVREISYGLGDSRLSLPNISVYYSENIWHGQVSEYRLAIQPQLASGVSKLIDEVSTLVETAQQVLGGFFQSENEPEVVLESRISSIPPIDISVSTGKGIVMDSIVKLPALRISNEGSLLQVCISSSNNTFQPSLAALALSILGSQQELEKYPYSSSIAGPEISEGLGKSTSKNLSFSSPFPTLIVLESTSIEFKGRHARCYGKLELEASMYLTPGCGIGYLPKANFAVHHPFASEDCISITIEEGIASLDADELLVDVASVSTNFLLRLAPELNIWVEEWMEALQGSPTASTSKENTDNAQMVSGELASISTYPTVSMEAKSFNFVVQMGQALGSAVFNFPGLFIGAEGNSIFFSFDANAEVSGRLQLSSVLHDAHALIVHQTEVTMLKFGYSSVSGLAMFQNETVLVFDMGTLDILGHIGEGSPKFDLKFGNIVLFTSSRTIPAFISIKHRLTEVSGARSLASSHSSQALENVPTGSEDILKASGQITILIASISCFVFGESLKENDHICAKAESILFNFILVQNDPIEASLKIHLNSLALLKSQTSKEIGQSIQQRARTSDDWVAFVTSHVNSKLIAQVPSSDLTMNTWTSRIERIVEHEFSTQFEGMIDLALNMILYRNLQDILTLYENEISRTIKTFQLQGNLTEQADIDANWIFRPTVPPILAPRLKMMGEATPPLDWLMNKDLVPEKTHLLVTLTLARVLNFASSR